MNEALEKARIDLDRAAEGLRAELRQAVKNMEHCKPGHEDGDLFASPAPEQEGTVTP